MVLFTGGTLSTKLMPSISASIREQSTAVPANCLKSLHAEMTQLESEGSETAVMSG